MPNQEKTVVRLTLGTPHKGKTVMRLTSGVLYIVQERRKVMNNQTIVRLLVAATPAEAEVFQDQINRFEEQNPDIKPALLTAPYSEFNSLLLALIEGKYPLDAAVLSYNHVALQQMEGSLQPLDDLIDDSDLTDFLPDALESNTFGDQLFALPWVRSGCLSHYRNLALFNASENPNEAFKLINFLSQPLQQIEYFIRLNWFPTRQSLYSPLGIDCPTPHEIIRLTPENTLKAIQLISERSINLKPVLEGAQLNPFEGTAELVDNEITAATAPMANPISEEEFVHALSDGGLIVGALFLNQEFPIKNPSGEIVGALAPGDYAVQLKADPESQPLQVRFYMINSAGIEIEFSPGHFDSLKVPVIQSFTTVEPNTLCCYFDRRSLCC